MKNYYLKSVLGLIASLVLLLAFSFNLFSQDKDTLWTRLMLPYRLQNAVFSPDDQFIYVTTTDPYYVMKYDLQGNKLWESDTIGGIRQFSEDGRFFWNYYGDKFDANTFGKLFAFGDGGLEVNGWWFQLNESTDIGIAVTGSHVIEETQFRRYYDSNLIIFRPSDLKILKYESYPGKVFGYRAMSVNPDGRTTAFLIASTAKDSKGKLFTDTFRLEIWDILYNKKLREIQIAMPVNDGTLNLKYSPDGSVLGYQHDGKLTLFNTTDYSIVWESSDLSLFNFSWSPNMEYLLCSRGEFGLIKYEYQTKDFLYYYSLPSYSRFINFNKNSSIVLCSWGPELLCVINNTLTSVKDNFFIDKMNINLIQNQINNSILLTILSYETYRAKYTIINTLGITQTKQQEINLSQGLNQFEMDISKLISGTYFLNITIDNHSQNIKFVFVR